MRLPPLPQHTINGHTFDYNKMVVVMAIVNRTPDSFHDRGVTFEFNDALKAATEAVAHGAHWVDIGAIPFNPWKGRRVSEDEEISRLVPLVEAIRGAGVTVPISIDTVRPEVAHAALRAGANIINDTSGLHYFDEMCEVVAEEGAHLIIGHSLAVPPHTPVIRPSYEDVVRQVCDFLRDRVLRASQAGVNPLHIMIDPAFDLNKNTRHTLQLVRGLEEIAALSCPVVAAASRKHFIAESIGVERDEAGVAGTIATNAIAVVQGARILRVHDVPEAVETALVAGALIGLHGPKRAVHNLA